MGDGEFDITRTRRLLFVCMGNICRSPLAEAIFGSLAEERGVRAAFTLDSCGTGAWHAGQGPDPRTVDVARRYGLGLDHVARQIDPRRDFDRFDLLLVMDRSNYAHVVELEPDRRVMVRMMRSFDSAAGDGRVGREQRGPDVPDPYHGGADGFEKMYWILHGACAGLLDEVLGAGDGGSAT